MSDSIVVPLLLILVSGRTRNGKILYHTTRPGFVLVPGARYVYYYVHKYKDHFNINTNIIQSLKFRTVWYDRYDGGPATYCARFKHGRDPNGLQPSFHLDPRPAIGIMMFMLGEISAARRTSHAHTASIRRLLLLDLSLLKIQDRRSYRRFIDLYDITASAGTIGNPLGWAWVLVC